MSYVLVIGAKSDIAKAIAQVYAKNKHDLYLAARNSRVLKELAEDTKIRNNVNVQLKEFNIIDFHTHEDFYNSLNPKPKGVIIVAGYMAEQKKCERNFTETLNTINVNYTGAVCLLNVVAKDMEKNKKGFIIGVSSVAGDRGRKTNYIYGSSKAAFTAYLSGLRNRLHGSNVKVLTVKPGFVNTKMTKSLDLPKKLTAQPEDIASNIFYAQQKGKDILYVKWIWKLIMLVIRMIPEWKFKKMSL